MSPVERLTAALADRNRIERELGQGGMATARLADDLKHHRDLAVNSPDGGGLRDRARRLAGVGKDDGDRTLVRDAALPESRAGDCREGNYGT